MNNFVGELVHVRYFGKCLAATVTNLAPLTVYVLHDPGAYFQKVSEDEIHDVIGGCESYFDGDEAYILGKP